VANATENGAYEVVVVGAGNAGLVAALAARQQGGNVLVLECAGRELRGGNSRFSGGIFRAVHSGLESLRPLLGEHAASADGVSVQPYGRDRYRDDWLRVSQGRTDPALLDTVVERSFDTLVWMREQGVEWELASAKLFDRSRLGAGVTYEVPPGGAIRAVHEGAGLVDRLFAAVDAAGIEVWYDAPAVGLVLDGSAVGGVRVGLKDRSLDVRGQVVLAAGGFESSPEMRARYLGPGWDLVKVRGTRFNTGTMLTEALASGAQAAGHWSGCHSTPIDATAGAYGDIKMTDKSARYSYPYSLMVNSAGERFVDEGEDQVWLTYAKTGSAIRQQPGNVAFQIFDQRTIHLLEPRYVTGVPVVAPTLGELAAMLGLRRGRLERTVEAFNAAVSPDAAEHFDPFSNDGVAAEPEGQPPKSNWALPLDRGPFTAYACSCGITFTYGGVKVDTQARVLDLGGRPIAGLFATGEIAGDFFYYNYGAGMGLMRGAVFGRIAGVSAARAVSVSMAP
jgi:tricarballylate dehydrogenase